MGKLIPFATNYIFFCKNCSPTGLESFRKCQASKPTFNHQSNNEIVHLQLFIVNNDNDFDFVLNKLRFEKFTAISQMCVTAIANLQQQAQKKGKLKYLFDKDEEVIPYMEQYWESMTTMPRRVTQSWYVHNIR